MHEYDSIRNELIAMEEIQLNLWIAMYASYFTLFVLAMQWSYYILLLTFIVLIPFQSKILRYKWSIIRMSMFIVVFFESERKDLHWETFHSCSDEFKQYCKKFNKGLSSIFSETGAVQLGVISMITFWSYIIYYSIQTHRVSYIDMLLVLLSIVGAIMIFILKRKYGNFGRDVDDVIKEYKEKLERQ